MAKTHKIKSIEFCGRNVPIVLQDKNGPCALLAICNVLLLKNNLNLGPHVAEISEEKLISLVTDRFKYLKRDVDNKEAGYVEKISKAIDLLPSLKNEIGVNLKFKRITEFVDTRGECEIFNLLGISLYHGWIVDPRDRDTYNAFGSKSYDTLSTDLAASGTDTVPSEYKTKPSPGLSSVSVSEHNKARTRKGDIEEDAELQRALKLSEAEISGQRGALIRKFVKANSSQLTVHGLSRLQEEVKEDELCVFFRNNHFNTMFKHGGKLYLLATDEGFLNQPNLAWEKLDDVKGNTKYMTGSFNEFKAEDHGYLASAYDDSSYKELAITLQESEFEQQPQRNPQKQTVTRGSGLVTGPQMEEEDWEWSLFGPNLIGSLREQVRVEYERLLVPACKDTKLSLRLYDEGFLYITSLVKSREDHRNILVALNAESWKGAKDILWVVKDMKEVDGNNMYFAIVDKDIFRHLSNHDHDAIESYIREVTRLLRPGGILFCFTPHLHSLDLLFSSFSVGWSMDFYFAIRDRFPAFFVGLEMMESQLPFPIQPKSDFNDSENVRDKINIENKRRLKGDLCVSRTIRYDNLFELQAWNEVQPSESELFRLQFWFEDYSAFKHLITVHDIKEVAPDSHVSLFLVPDNMQKHDILKSEEQRCLIKAVPDTSCRLIVVCVGPNLKYEKKKDAIMMHLKYLLNWLVPVTCSSEIPAWIKFLGQSHIKEARKKCKTSLPLPLPTSASSPLQAAASSVGASTSSSGVATVLSSHVASLAAQTPPESTMLVSSEGTDVEKEDVVEMPYDTSLAAQTHSESTMLVSSEGAEVEKEDVSGSKLLVEIAYDTDLKEWLSSNKKRWSNEHWNKLDSRRKNKTDSIPEWNALRPTENCAELIQGILKTFVKLKQKGLVNGYLDDSSNYKLSFSKEFDKGILRSVVNVHFVHGKEEIDINRNSHEWDIKCVMRMVFDVILEGVTLPRIWQSLYNLMGEMLDESTYSLLSADYKNRHLLAIQDHYCCWNWKDRVSFYDRFWSVLKWGSETSDELQPVVLWILECINRRMLQNGNFWHCDIPLDSPWRRLFDAQNIGDNAYQQLRYVRSLLLHYKELNADRTKRYFEEDEEIDDNDEYVELLVCECFYPFVDTCCLIQPFYYPKILDTTNS